MSLHTIIAIAGIILLPFVAVWFLGDILKSFRSVEDEKARKAEELTSMHKAAKTMSNVMVNANESVEPISNIETKEKTSVDLTKPVLKVAQDLAKPAIGFYRLHRDLHQVRETGSWIGGWPKLADEQQWPYGKSRDEKHDVPMHFLAQIDLADMPVETSRKLNLPSLGSLIFFAPLNWPMTARVIYIPAGKRFKIESLLQIYRKFSLRLRLNQTQEHFLRLICSHFHFPLHLLLTTFSV